MKETFAAKKSGICFWITGLAGSGKTTLAEAAVKWIREHDISVVLVDGDLIREIISAESRHDRNSRLQIAGQISRLCKNLTDQGIHVICATISLFTEIHDWNRSHIKNYHEIYVDVPMSELERRDKKQLYSKAKLGETINVVGVDIAFDKPSRPELVLENHEGALEENTQKLIHYIQGVLKHA